MLLLKVVELMFFQIFFQVGNETYSLVVTDEDWEKRKFERERQKRLSQETNRRRKYDHVMNKIDQNLITN